MSRGARGRRPAASPLGLTDAELEAIHDRLQRAPNDLELAMFCVMWSEHCSYKSSKPLLRTLPTAGSDVVAGPGENAGVVAHRGRSRGRFQDRVAQPPKRSGAHQGAATGVGGILRDIVTMGARPVAVLDGLKFGDLTIGARATWSRRRAGRRRLRQLRRGAHGRRRARLSTRAIRATHWST